MTRRTLRVVALAFGAAVAPSLASAVAVGAPETTRVAPPPSASASAPAPPASAADGSGVSAAPSGEAVAPAPAAPSGDAGAPPPTAVTPPASEAAAAVPAPVSDVVRSCVRRHGEAQEQRLEGRLVEARRALVECGHAECPGPVRADCTLWSAEVERSIPTVVIAARSERGDEPGVRVLVDGVSLNEGVDGGAIAVDPGAHRFRFELPGRASVEVLVVVREGEKNRQIVADFAPARRPAPPPAPSSGVESASPLAWWLGGAALASAAVGTGFGLSALDARDEHRRQCAPLCSEEAAREVRTRALVADVAFGVSLLAAGTAVVLVLQDSEAHRGRDRAERALVIEGAIGPQGGGVDVRGRF
jgi:hypothetical protein